MSTTEPGHQRADATRNRARLLEAADAVLAERGPAGTTEEVARRAGVAVGTVFRHFPRKEDLIAAVFTQRLRRLNDEACELIDRDESGEAFFEFLIRWTELAATKQVFVDVLRGGGIDVEAVANSNDYPQVRSQLLETLATLLERAQAVGAVRADISVHEVFAVMAGAARAVEHLADEPASRRVAGLVLEGLRPAR